MTGRQGCWEEGGWELGASGWVGLAPTRKEILVLLSKHMLAYWSAAVTGLVVPE